MAKQDTKPPQGKGTKPQGQPGGQQKGDKKGRDGGNAQSGPALEVNESGSASTIVLPSGERYVSRLRTRYLEEVVPSLQKQFGYTNAMQVPQVKKVIINIGMGNEARENAKSLDSAVSDLGIITGQKAVITRAKKSIAAFKLRTGMPIGVMVTLRNTRMYDFLDKLFNVSLARVRDFSGVTPSSFDGHGNFSLGLREQLIFPEIEYDRVDKIRGMEVVIVTTAKTDEEGRALLQAMGMPFKKG